MQEFNNCFLIFVLFCTLLPEKLHAELSVIKKELVLFVVIACEYTHDIRNCPGLAATRPNSGAVLRF